jgi:predicted ATPase
MLHRGIALSMQGRHAEAITQLQQALASWQSTGAEMQLPYFLSHLAAAYGRASRAGEGLHLVAEAQEIIQNTGEWVHDAEVRRVQGELLLAVSPDHHEQAQDCFLHACTLARRQQAKSWEQRAASSLARLWQRQGKRAEAIALLQPVYDWFTEGFDTADLRAAQALLDSCHPLGLVTP